MNECFFSLAGPHCIAPGFPVEDEKILMAGMILSDGKFLLERTTRRLVDGWIQKGLVTSSHMVSELKIVGDVLYLQSFSNLAYIP